MMIKKLMLLIIMMTDEGLLLKVLNIPREAVTIDRIVVDVHHHHPHHHHDQRGGDNRLVLQRRFHGWKDRLCFCGGSFASKVFYLSSL